LHFSKRANHKKGFNLKVHIYFSALFFSWLGFHCSFQGNVLHITPDFSSLSQKVVAALIVTGQCGADKNSKTMQYIPST